MTKLMAETLYSIKEKYCKSVEELKKCNGFTMSSCSFTPEWTKQRERNMFKPVGKELKRFTVAIEMVVKDD